MPDSMRFAVRELDRHKKTFGQNVARRKIELLKAAKKNKASRAREVLALHETLCFMRAYPDSPEVLKRVEELLAGFGGRSDLRRFSEELAETGVAGTELRFPFFAESAGWLARRWPKNLTIDWEAFEDPDKLEDLLPILGLYGESPGLDEFAFEMREWIDLLKGPHDTDAVFLLRRLEQIRMDPFLRETLLENLEIPFRLSPGADTPARTREKLPPKRIAYLAEAPQRARLNMLDEIARPPISIRALSPAAGKAVVDLARSAMATRSRDLNAFAYGDRRDVRMVDCGNGLVFAYVGVIPERRFLLESLYGFLVLKNGVPIGYGTNVSLFDSSEVAFTIFDTFRGSETAFIYGRLLAITKHLLHADTYTVDPYQIGKDNDDAVSSGAWWFYQKLGFRPREPGALRVMRRELKRMKKNPLFRSPAATLKGLAEENIFLQTGGEREDMLGLVSLGNVGLRVTRYVAGRFGYDRRRATEVCAAEARKLLGVRSLAGFSAGEKLAWKRWAPLVMILPGVGRWSHQQKNRLVAVVRAKGGKRESDYLLRFDRHRGLRAAVLALAEDE